MPIKDRIAWIGLALGPVLALAVFALLPDAEAGGLGHAGRATAAIGVWMATWWMTEAIPLPATALLPVVLFPLTGVLDIVTATRPYASDIIFLFMGGFMIGLAMKRWSLHRRIALGIIRLVGTSPTRLVAGFMIATAMLSMWISNTASAVMLLPVGMSVIELLRRHVGGDGEVLVDFQVCLMLAIAYGASIGGLGTLIGSPPNLILANFAANHLGVEITMLDWMKLGLPMVALMLPATWLYLTRVVHPVKLTVPAAVEAEIAAELRGLGPMSRGERMVLGVFTLTALGWLFRPQLAALTGIPGLTDAGIAMTGALALFVLPVDARRREFVLDWQTAVQLPWGILLLFGGGLSLATAISANGVDTFLASGFSGLAGVHILWVLLAVAALVIFLTEITSNTAVTNTLLPVLAAAAIGLGLDPMPILLGAAMAASCAFMLPVATPPNAIVFASGMVTIGQMVRAGFGLNLIGLGLVVFVVGVLGRL